MTGIELVTDDVTPCGVASACDHPAMWRTTLAGGLARLDFCACHTPEQIWQTLPEKELGQTVLRAALEADAFELNSDGTFRLKEGGS